MGRASYFICPSEQVQKFIELLSLYWGSRLVSTWILKSPHIIQRSFLSANFRKRSSSSSRNPVSQTEEYRNIIPVSLIDSGSKNRKFSLSQQNCCSAHQTKFQPKLWIRGALGVISRPSHALSAYHALFGQYRWISWRYTTIGRPGPIRLLLLPARLPACSIYTFKSHISHQI